MNDAPQFSATYTPSTGLTPHEFDYVDDEGQPDKNIRYSVAYDSHAFDLMSPSALVDPTFTQQPYEDTSRQSNEPIQSSHTSGGSSSDASVKHHVQFGGPSQSSLHINKVDSAYGSNLDQSSTGLRLFKSTSKTGLNRVSSQPAKGGRAIYQKMTAPKLKTSESMGPSSSIGRSDESYESDDKVARSLSTSIPRSKRNSAETGNPRPGRMSMSLRKGRGLTGMMNNVFGSSRKISISEPQTVMHLVHVGVDSETGEYTVCYMAMREPPYACAIMITDFSHAGVTGRMESSTGARGRDQSGSGEDQSTDHG